mmetsp:Transcript_129130/g.306374  ORF Transcript_129130/g.306374 Transcript_129130/m.306374 type:complete len:685 (-) Transcript_129130:95-2149(-)
MRQLEAGLPDLPPEGLLEQVLDAFPRLSQVLHHQNRQPLKAVRGVIQLLLRQAVLVRGVAVLPLRSVSARRGSRQGSVHWVLHVRPNDLQHGGGRFLLNGEEQKSLERPPSLLGVLPMHLAHVPQGLLAHLKLVHLLQVVLQQPGHQRPCIFADVPNDTDRRLRSSAAESSLLALAPHVVLRSEGHELLEDESDRLGMAPLLDKPAPKAVVVVCASPLDGERQLLPHPDRLGGFGLRGGHGATTAQHRRQDHVLQAIVDGVDLHLPAVHDGVRVVDVLLGHRLIAHELLYRGFQQLRKFLVLPLARCVIRRPGVDHVQDAANHVRDAASALTYHQRAAGFDRLHQGVQRHLPAVDQDHDTRDRHGVRGALGHVVFEESPESDLRTEGRIPHLAVVTYDEVRVIVLQRREAFLRLRRRSRVHLCHLAVVLVGRTQDLPPLAGQRTKGADANAGHLALLVVALHSLAHDIHDPAGSAARDDPGAGPGRSLYEALGKAVDVELVGRQVHVPCAAHDGQHQVRGAQVPHRANHLLEDVLRRRAVGDHAVRRSAPIEGNLCRHVGGSVRRLQGDLALSRLLRLAQRRLLVAPGAGAPVVAEHHSQPGGPKLAATAAAAAYALAAGLPKAQRLVGAREVAHWGRAALLEVLLSLVREDVRDGLREVSGSAGGLPPMFGDCVADAPPAQRW